MPTAHVICTYGIPSIIANYVLHNEKCTNFTKNACIEESKKTSEISVEEFLKELTDVFKAASQMRFK